MINILVIGRHHDIVETVLRLLNNESGYKASGATTDEEAFETFAKEKFDLVLIGGGVNEESEQQLTQEFLTIHPETKIVKHYGGGSGLLFAEIAEAMKRK